MLNFTRIFIAVVAFLFVNQSFAQPRDLFAEFEAEVSESSSSEAVPVSSAKVSSSSVATPVSSAEVSSSSAVSVSSSSLEVSSSSVAPPSSAIVMDSAEAAKLQQAEINRINAEKQAAIQRAIQQAQAQEAEKARIADSIKAVRASWTPEDSALAAQDSIMNVQDSLLAAQVSALPVDSAVVQDSLAADSAAAVAVSSSSATAPSYKSRRDLLGPVKVSKVNGIDEMKGRYKSPRKALFMSLVVPGSGQLYVGGSNFTYVRGGVYLALEAALWSGWYYYSVYKYDNQVNRYKKYAKQHYSIGKYEQGMRDLYNADGGANEAEFRRRYLGSRESFCEGIFGKATMHGCYDRDKLYHNDVEYMNDFVKAPQELGDEMKKVKFDASAEVYQLIADKSYILGWDDVREVPPASALELEDPNSSTVSLGKSDHQKEYRSIRSKATDYADMQAWFFGGIILNHIISAVDAAFTANAHNKALYEEELSWYDRLHFDSGVSLFDGFGVTVQASWGF